MQIDKRELFDSLFGGYTTSKVWFTPKEVGSIIGRSDQFVRECFHAGVLMGHISNKKKHREYITFHRDAIYIFLLQTANYSPDTYVDKILNIVKKLSNEHLNEIKKILQKRKIIE